MDCVSALIPSGTPNFENIRFYPSIVQLSEQHGKKVIRKVLTALVKNFCDSINVPEGKNMNATQMVEAACFLLDECDNYRIEDYAMMFTLAKRGHLNVRVFDRVDIQLVSDFKASYEALRRQYDESIREQQIQKEETRLIPDERDNPNEPESVKIERFNEALRRLKELKLKIQKEKQEQAQKEREELQKKKEEMLEQMKKLAEKNGYKGPFINLDAFTKNKK